MTILEVIEVSGLAAPTHNSGAANKKYVDDYATSGQNYAYSYLVYKDGSDYKAQQGVDGSIDSTNTNGTTVLQYAIDNSPSGEVYLATDIALSTTVSGQNHTILNLGGHKVTQVSAINMFRMVPNFEVKNGEIVTTEDMVGKSVFKFSGYYNWTNGRRTAVRNVVCRNSSTYNSGTAFHFLCDADSNGIVGVHIENTHTQFYKYAYRLEAINATSSDRYVNGNYFNNISSYCDRYVMWISSQLSDSNNSCDANIFKFQVQPAAGYNNYGVWCNGEGNIFEGVLWDWSAAANDSVYLHPSSQKNFVRLYGGTTDVNNLGTKNTMMDVYDSKLRINSIYGDGVSTDEFNLYANTEDASGRLQLDGSGAISLYTHPDTGGGGYVQFKHAGGARWLLARQFNGNNTYLYGGDTAGDDLTIRANSAESRPNMVLYGSSNHEFNTSTDKDWVYYVNGAERFRYDSSAHNWTNISSQAISGGTITGHYQTSLYATKPAAASHTGEIIRVSGSSTDKTYVFMSVRNDAGSNEWIQLGVST